MLFVRRTIRSFLFAMPQVYAVRAGVQGRRNSNCTTAGVGFREPRRVYSSAGDGTWTRRRGAALRKVGTGAGKASSICSLAAAISSCVGGLIWITMLLLTSEACWNRFLRGWTDLDHD